MPSHALVRSIDDPSRICSFVRYVTGEVGTFIAKSLEDGEEVSERVSEFEPIDGHGHVVEWPNGRLLRAAQWGGLEELQSLERLLDVTRRIASSINQGRVGQAGTVMLVSPQLDKRLVDEFNQVLKDIQAATIREVAWAEPR